MCAQSKPVIYFVCVFYVRQAWQNGAEFILVHLVRYAADAQCLAIVYGISDNEIIVQQQNMHIQIA